MIDYHIHTNHSIDAEGSLDEYLEQALKLSLREICITNHCELDSLRNDNLIRIEDKILPIKKENLLFLQNEIIARESYYKDKGLRIKFGIEVGYFEGIGKRLKEVTDDLKLDYILGAIHCLEHICIDSSKEYERYFTQKGVDELLSNYYNTLKELVKSHLFDGVAHLDVYKKYGLGFYGETIRKIPKDKVFEIFKLIAENGIALEINTAGLRRHNEFYPSVDFMKIAKEAGVELVTVGSDCHRADDLGRGIKEAIEYVKMFGFKYIFGFSGRKPIPYKI
uniref:Histidinol-phosphatase n=1 Tax=candidate division WOR-3 bacterium TaxID=2052148 RepID=A0A7C4XFX4_UNCW3